MRLRLIYLGFIFSFFHITVLASYEDVSSIFSQVNNSIGIDFFNRYLDYVENIGAVNPSLNVVKESGINYGMDVDIRRIFYKKIYGNIHGDASMGVMNYDGYTLYDSVPIKCKLNQRFANADMKLGIILDGLKLQFIPYGKIGVHYWNYFNNNYYFNCVATMGVKVSYALTNDILLSPYFEVGQTFNSYTSFLVHGKNNDLNDDFVLNLGSKPIIVIGAEANYPLNNNIYLDFGIDYVHFSYEKSIGRITSDGSEVHIEPPSRTNEIKFKIGLKYS